ncbi:MAG: hypothetical protein JKY02_02075 [Flavobacteriaceae bacterium]|nr:hypothetical protein [Flavobacteriaceae bacterium]
MDIKELKSRKTFDNQKIQNGYTQFEELLALLQKRSLGEKSIQCINSEIDTINSIRVSNNELRKQVRKSQAKMLLVLKKEDEIVPKNHYRNLWMALGMTVFGVPLGVTFGASIENMGFIGIGMPIGMMIGIALGTKKDKDAASAGKQLTIVLKHY